MNSEQKKHYEHLKQSLGLRQAVEFALSCLVSWHDTEFYTLEDLLDLVGIYIKRDAIEASEMKTEDVANRYSEDLYNNSVQHGQHVKRHVELTEVIMSLQERITALEASLIGAGLPLYERRKEETTTP